MRVSWIFLLGVYSIIALITFVDSDDDVDDDDDNGNEKGTETTQKPEHLSLLENRMLHHCLRIILLVVTLIGIVTSQDNNLAGDEDKIGPLQMSRTQLVVAVTFPSAILVGILFCLCLTKSLGIDSWQSKHNKVEPKKIPPKATTQPKRTPRFSPTNSRVSSSSTGTSASYKHYSC